MWLMFLLFFGQTDLAAAAKGRAPQLASQNGFGDKSTFRKQPSFAAEDEKTAIAKTKILVAEIVRDSFSELKNVQIEVKSFRSAASYFRSSFSFAGFLLAKKLRYKVFVNPRVFDLKAPEDGLRAILAHELSHILYYERHNRWELFGLLGLVRQNFTIRFERGADLETINRGYGAGLKSYRNWLYQNIPTSQLAKKKRNYFTPEEIELLGETLKQRPDLINYYRQNIPRNLAEIRETAEN